MRGHVTPRIALAALLGAATLSLTSCHEGASRATETPATPTARGFVRLSPGERAFVSRLETTERLLGISNAPACRATSDRARLVCYQTRRRALNTPAEGAACDPSIPHHLAVVDRWIGTHRLSARTLSPSASRRGSRGIPSERTGVATSVTFFTFLLLSALPFLLLGVVLAVASSIAPAQDPTPQAVGAHARSEIDQASQTLLEEASKLLRGRSTYHP